MRRLTKLASSLLALVFVGMQFVPTAAQPAPVRESGSHMAQVIGSPVGAILDRSCQDCHSGHTNWPWYGRIAPMSWVLSRDVSRGLEKLDLSQWSGRAHSANERMEICDAVSDGSMPLRAYTLIHRDARLSKRDIESICDWAADPQSAPSLRAGRSAPNNIYRKGPR